MKDRVKLVLWLVVALWWSFVTWMLWRLLAVVKRLEDANWCTEGWRGGKFTSEEGYVMIREDGRYKQEHRIIMERALGRGLLEAEIVHHLNGLPDDNRIENLELLPPGKHNTKVQEIYKENLFLKEQLANFLSIKV